MDYDDTADLLGNREMPIVRPQQSAIGSFFSFRTFALLLILVLSAGALARFVFTDMLPWLKRFKDQAARKALRRKYGIPDDDARPFNVAYSQAAMQREDMQRRLTQRSRPHPPQQPDEAEAGPSNLSQAAGLTSGSRQSSVASLNAQPDLSGSRAGPLGNGQPRGFFKQPTQPSKVNVRDFAHPEEVPRSPLPGRSTASQRLRGDGALDGNAPLSDSTWKRGQEREPIVESSRNEAKEDIDLVDAEVPMEVADVTGLPDVLERKGKRGFKRQARQEEDENLSSSPKKSGKRARRQSKKHRDHELEEENDQVMDLDPASSVRGKKRDRAEAGSTFGGEDDSPTGHERKSRRRKRKSLATADGSEGLSRGTKRSHDLESTMDSDEEHLSRSKISRKRGKRTITEPDDSTDISMDDIRVVKDPACGGRKIGEEWEANGQRYKVGPDGRRLRQALVKKRRSRYSMPADSAHPDSQAQMLVFIESWLNDDQYKEAEERGDIFSPKKPEPAEDEFQGFTPQKTGKQLLWSSPQKASRLPRMAFKDSIVTNIGLNINPFERPAETYTRRISSGHVASKQLTSIGSPGLRQSKSYSKWEKQDLEAEAMAKLRRKLEEEKKAAAPVAPSPKKVTFQLPTAPSLASSISAPTTSEASTANKEGIAAPKLPGNLFAPPSVTSTDSKGPSTGAQPPSINVIPPTRESSFTSEPSKPPIFSIPQLQPPKQDASTPASTTPVPSPFNSHPEAKAAPSPFGFNTTSQKSSGPAIPNFFGKSAGNDARTGVSANTTPADMFAPKPANNTTSAPSAGSAFVIKGAAQSDKEQPSSNSPLSAFGAQKPAEQQQSNNLLGRVSGAGSQGNNSAFAPPASGGFQSTFAFGSSKQPEAKQPEKAPSPFGISATTAPKFSFGSAAKPVSSTPPAATTSTPAPTTTTSTTDTPKTTTSQPVFKFNLTPPSNAGTAASSSAPMARPSSSSGAQFGFGQTQASASNMPSSNPSSNPLGSTPSSSSTQQQSSSNVFGNVGNTSSSSTPAASNASNAPKFSLASGGTGASFTHSTTFGSATGSSNTPSPFGAAGPSTFGSAPSTAKSGETPKPVFGGTSSFGASNPNTNTINATENKDKPTFSFNFGGAPQASSFSGFGSSSSSQQPAGNNAATSSPFGAKPADGPKPFTFGATGGSTSTPISFGANPSNSGTTGFGGGATPSPFGTAGGSSPFAFGSQSTNNTQK